MEAIATSLHPELRLEIMGDPSYDLWVYGHGRSCRVRDESCAFFVGQAQIALGSQIGNMEADIEAWLIDHTSILSLVSRGIELERHAEVLEIDPARWHWLHVLDRISNPRDTLVEISSLVAELARNSVVSQFYCYTSLNSLCFSASSHYPWVGDYPGVRPARFKEDAYVIEGAEYGLEDAIERIETVLRASPIEPFFGSASDYEIGLIANSLRRQGSSLCPEIVQREQWSDIWIKKNPRRCRLDSRWFTFFDGVTRLSGECAHVDDIVAIAIRFLEESAELAEIAADTRILK